MTKIKILLLSFICLLVATSLRADPRKTVKTASPVYPAIAAKMRVEGTVKLEATIESDGNVSDVKVLSGHQLLTQAAAEAVKKWKYESADAKSTQSVNVEFNLPH